MIWAANHPSCQQLASASELWQSHQIDKDFHGAADSKSTHVKRDSIDQNDGARELKRVALAIAPPFQQAPEQYACQNEQERSRLRGRGERRNGAHASRKSTT